MRIGSIAGGLMTLFALAIFIAWVICRCSRVGTYTLSAGGRADARESSAKLQEWVKELRANDPRFINISVTGVPPPTPPLSDTSSEDSAEYLEKSLGSGFSNPSYTTADINTPHQPNAHEIMIKARRDAMKKKC